MNNSIKERLLKEAADLKREYDHLMYKARGIQETSLNMNVDMDLLFETSKEIEERADEIEARMKEIYHIMLSTNIL